MYRSYSLNNAAAARRNVRNSAAVDFFPRFNTIYSPHWNAVAKQYSTRPVCYNQCLHYSLRKDSYRIDPAARNACLQWSGAITKRQRMSATRTSTSWQVPGMRTPAATGAWPTTPAEKQYRLPGSPVSENRRTASVQDCILMHPIPCGYRSHAGLGHKGRQSK